MLYQLAGTTCQCGAWKRAKRPFCVHCYKALTPDRQRALFKELGSGYDAAYNDAMSVLTGDGSAFAIPEDLP